MKIRSAALLLGSLCVSTMAIAQEQETYLYVTYFYCDVTQQERADEIVETLDKPIYDAAVADGSIGAWGWGAHHTGGKWRRFQYHMAPSMDALIASQKKIGEQIEAKDSALSEEAGKICNSHDDYIWRSVAGSTGARGPAGFSVYYVCDGREIQADELMKRIFGPKLDKLVEEGKLMSWGWLEHIVGGEYRRLATMTASDVPALIAARGSVVEMMLDDPLADTLDDICGSHADYIWEIQFEQP